MGMMVAKCVLQNAKHKEYTHFIKFLSSRIRIL